MREIRRIWVLVTTILNSFSSLVLDLENLHFSYKILVKHALVVTFWEGEIVDGKNYTFFTGKWEASSDDDIKHWTKFPPFQPFSDQVKVDGGKSLDLSNYPYIFMRWKEQYFVNVGTDCGLTIAGFYYVCFSCADESINGFYYDLSSSPFQKLELKSTNERRSGVLDGSWSEQHLINSNSNL